MRQQPRRIRCDVQQFDPKGWLGFFYKLFISDGQWHLWFCLRGGYYADRWTEGPDFTMREYSGWEHVGSWPVEVVFVEEAVEEVIATWFEHTRPRKIDIDEVREIGIDVAMRCAKSDDKDWISQKEYADKQRALHLAEVLTA